MNTDVNPVDQTIASRRSIRRFLPDPVPRETLTELLALAARAPSGTNIQPWRVYALAGEAKQAVSRAILAKFDAGETEGREFDYYPQQWFEPYIGRRRKIGVDLYQLLGIAKGDKVAMVRQTRRNYGFFDAPIGLIFTMHRSLGQGMFLDMGMFMANLMLAARARDLDTCAQATFADYPDTLRACLGLHHEELIVCGMALGYADPDAPENRLVTERESVEDFTDFRGL